MQDGIATSPADAASPYWRPVYDAVIVGTASPYESEVLEAVIVSGAFAIVNERAVVSASHEPLPVL